MDFQDSAPYKRYQSILDLPNDGTKEMAKAKEVAERKMGELATSHMAKQMGVEDPFKMERVKDPETGKTKMSPALLPEETRNIKSVSRPSTGGGASGGMGTGKMNRDISKLMKKGGKVSSASSRADGCATKGKTKGRFV
jgi:hypothetical protein